jgi:hypothetical protein
MRRLPIQKRSMVIGLIMASLPLPSFASTYEALCGDTACSISLDANGISSPAGFLPTPRIAQWFTGGEESYNAGAGTAGALGAATLGALGGGLLLGPIGLLGGLIGGGIAGSKAGKTADLFFNVVGYNQDGKKTTISFRFINPKPANRLKMELPMFTGLAMGQTRSLDDLRAALASPSGQATNPSLPEQIGTSPSAPAPGTTTAGTPAAAPPHTHGSRAAALPDQLLNTTPVAQPTINKEEQWQAYLKSRGLEQWAIRNPSIANQLRQRLFPGP